MNWEQCRERMLFRSLVSGETISVQCFKATGERSGGRPL